MGQELAGKVAIVTGGASGIGKATVELFVAEGAKVVFADINEEQGQAMAASLGPTALFKRTDVSNRAEVQALVDFAIERFGGLHIMFNNAGISGAQHARFLDDPLDDFQKVIGINLFGVLIGTQCAARHMKEHGGGVILNNASIAGVLPGQALIAYRASKAALIMATKSNAIDLAEYNIRVNVLAPGHIRTPLTSFAPPGISPEVAERVKLAVGAAFDVNQPLKRAGRPEDVAQVVLFMVGERSAQITGTVLPVDGGITAGDPVNHLREIMEARAAALATA